jgi:hypothetical protein
LLSVVAFAALIGVLLLTKQAAGTAGTTGTIETNTTTTTETNATSTTVNGDGNDFQCWNNGGIGFGPGFGGGPEHGRRGGPAGYGSIQVSEEFEQNVINIAKNDTDVQNLLAEGYNITSVRPIISTVIDAEGYVTTRATTAVLMLQKDTSGVAFVSVDIEEAKVTEIVILTRTVIEKT